MYISLSVSLVLALEVVLVLSCLDVVPSYFSGPSSGEKFAEVLNCIHRTSKRSDPAMALEIGLTLLQATTTPGIFLDGVLL